MPCHASRDRTCGCQPGRMEWAYKSTGEALETFPLGLPTRPPSQNLETPSGTLYGQFSPSRTTRLRRRIWNVPATHSGVKPNLKPGLANSSLGRPA